MDSNLYYWKIDNWGEKVIGSHGTLFIGVFCNNMQLLFPVLLLCDENGTYVDFDESELIPALEQVNDSDIRYFKPTELENEQYKKIYAQLIEKMLKRYQKQTEPLKTYNKRKLENWERIQMEQLVATYQEMNAEIEEIKEQERTSDNFYEKIDIRKKIAEKTKELEQFQASFHEKVDAFKAEGQREIAEFNKKFDINPLLLVNIVLKF